MAPIAIWSLPQTTASGRSRPRPAGSPGRQLAADRGEPALEGPARGGARVLGEHFLEGAAPGPRVRRVGRAGDVEQPGPAVHLDEVADERLGPGTVVGVDDVDVRLVRRAGDQHDRQPGRQPGQLLRADDALGDQQPVDLAGHRLQPLVGGVAGLEERDQQRPADLAQRGLDAAQHLLDEQQAGLLDVGIGAAALDGDQADHLLALPGQALRRPVRDIAERLDHLETRWRVDGLTRSWPCTTRDTVAVETPASRATS